MLTTYDPAVRPSPVCCGCGLPHLLPGGEVYVVPTPSRQLVVSRGCVIEESVRLTRVVCHALTRAEFRRLMGALCAAEVACGSEYARTCLAIDAVAEVVPSKCEWCGTERDAEDTTGLCVGCQELLRGW